MDRVVQVTKPEHDDRSKCGQCGARVPCGTLRPISYVDEMRDGPDAAPFTIFAFVGRCTRGHMMIVALDV